MPGQVGAPKGGRVHHLLWALSREFKGEYVLNFDYARHNYVFSKYFRRQLAEVFIVMQTSAHSWRCTHYKRIFAEKGKKEEYKFCYFTANSATTIAKEMERRANINVFDHKDNTFRRWRFNTYRE